MIGSGSESEPWLWADRTVEESCQGYRYPKRTYHYDDTLAGDGYYWIQPAGLDSAITVYCDMSYDGGGWTRIDRDCASALAGEAVSIQAEGRSRCIEVEGGGFEASYDPSINTVPSSVVCEYNIHLGFGVDHIRMGEGVDAMTFAPVNLSGNSIEIANFLGKPWGTGLDGDNPNAGDIIIGLAADASGVLSLGSSLGLAGNDTRLFFAGERIPWPAVNHEARALAKDATLRIQASEQGPDGEGVRWVSGAIYVRDSASLGR